VKNNESWNVYVNPLVSSLPFSGIRKFFDLVAEAKGIISLGVGEPDFITPWHIREACIYSLEKGYTMYTSNQGLFELRQAIARDLETTSGVVYDPGREILVTVGVSEGLDLALRALVCPGDEILLAEPAYVSYAPCVLLAGGKVITIPTTMEEGFRLTAGKIEAAITPRTKILIMCYPNNPTGAVMDRETLLEIAQVVKAHDLFVISDEIYSRLTYAGEHTCLASLPGMRDRTILLNGFSKAYAMTGWRIGYAAGNPDFITAMTKIHQYTMLCAPVTAQMAALEALKNGQLAMTQMIQQYNRRRLLVIHAFQDMGLPCFEPGGAFYAFPEIVRTGLSSEEFAWQLLQEEKVAVVPGNAFGASGEGYVRCSYAAAVEDLSVAFRRLASFCQARGVRPKIITTPRSLPAGYKLVAGEVTG
jgi:aminotransferase